MKTLKELKTQLTPEVRATASANAAAIISQLSLSEMRKSRGQNQVAVALELGLTQPHISQIERRPDALISTLSAYVKALGGELELRANFPDGQSVAITQFSRK